MEKREFLKTASKATLISVLGINLVSCASDEAPNPNANPAPGGPADPNNPPDTNAEAFTFDTSAGDFTSLSTAGSWKNEKTAKILLVNVGGGTIRAFTNICTHQQCSDNWTFAGEQATCTCHTSVFSNTGAVVSGPAPSALEEFTVTREGTKYTVKN